MIEEHEKKEWRLTEDESEEFTDFVVATEEKEDN